MTQERIDTSKYEGHTEGPWDVYGPHPLFRGGAFDDEGVGEHLPFTRVDIELIADAPEILAELKRCYEEIDYLVDMLHKLGYYGKNISEEKQLEWEGASE